MSKEENKEYKAKLDDKILYLLRLKAMQMEIVDKRYTCRTHKRLYHLLMNNQETIDEIEMGTSYFEKLKKEIGLKDDSTFDDPKYKVSVTTLKRLYGKVHADKPVSTKTLNCIAKFISDMQYSWDELQERVDALTEELEKDCLWVGSGPIRMEDMARPEDGMINKVYSSSLVKGDKLYLMFDNEKTLVLYYKGNNTYKVTYTESKTLKVGYTMIITKMRCHGHIHTSEVFDKDGNLIGGYESDTIKTIEFVGDPDVEWQETVNRIEQSGLGLVQK